MLYKSMQWSFDQNGCTANEKLALIWMALRIGMDTTVRVTTEMGVFCHRDTEKQ